MYKLMATLMAVVAMASLAASQSMTTEQCAAFNSNCTTCVANTGCIYCTPTVTGQGSCVPTDQQSLCSSVYGIPATTCGMLSPSIAGCAFVEAWVRNQRLCAQLVH